MEEIPAALLWALGKVDLGVLDDLGTIFEDMMDARVRGVV